MQLLSVYDTEPHRRIQPPGHEWVYSKGFPLVDVTVIDDDEIMNHRRMAALTLLMKHIRQRDMMELLDKLPQVMVEWISPEQVRVLINYMVSAGEAPAPEFMRALAERLPQHDEPPRFSGRVFCL